MNKPVSNDPSTGKTNIKKIEYLNIVFIVMFDQIRKKSINHQTATQKLEDLLKDIKVSHRTSHLSLIQIYGSKRYK